MKLKIFKNYKKYLVILILLSLILPKFSYAIVWWLIGGGAALGLLGGIAAYFGIGKLTGAVANFFIGAVNFLLDLLLPTISGFFDFLSKVAAVVINNFLAVNIFGTESLAAVLWETFKNIAYVALVFLSLLAGFQFILNRDDQARRMLFGIIIVALLINFTFLLARVFSETMIYITINLLKTVHPNPEAVTSIGQSHLGNILYTSLNILTISGVKEQLQNIKHDLGVSVSADEVPPTEIEKNAIKLFALLFELFINAVIALIMWMIAGLSIGRYIVLSFLVGVLPAVCIAYTLPSTSNYFQRWWNYFLNFNIAIPILVVLLIIGIGLTVAIGQSLPFIKGGDPREFHGSVEIFGINNINSLIFILNYVMRLSFLVAYYVGVVVIALRLGGSFASYAYRSFNWITLTTGGAIAGFVQKHGGRVLGGGLETLGKKMSGNTTPIIGGLIRKAGRTLQDTGERLKKPRSEEVKEDVRGIWESVKDKSPSEIINTAIKLRGDHFRTFVEFMSKELDADTLWKIYQDPQFRSKLLKDKQALKIFSKGLNGIPALLNEAQSLYKEEKVDQANNLIQQAQSKFATSGLSGQMSVDELISLYNRLYSEAGLRDANERAKEAVSNLILAMNRRQRTNFLTYNTPKNLKDKLGDKNYAPLVEFQKDTPTYKALRGQLEDRLYTPDLDPKQREELIKRLLESYARGEELGTELERFFGEVVRSTDEEISRLQEKFNELKEEKNRALQQAQKELEEIKNQLSQIRLPGGAIPLDDENRKRLSQEKQNKEKQIQELTQELKNIEAEFEQQIQALESKRSSIETGRDTAKISLNQIIRDHENIAKQFSPEISTSLSQTQPQQSSQTPKQSS
jgi:flagellar motility protein MotE (MotC chaperone)